MELSHKMFFGIVCTVALLQLSLALAGVLVFGSAESNAIGAVNIAVLLIFGRWLAKNNSSWKEVLLNGTIAGILMVAMLITFVLIGKAVGRPVLGIFVPSTETLVLVLAVLSLANITLAIASTAIGALTVKLNRKKFKS